MVNRRFVATAGAGVLAAALVVGVAVGAAADSKPLDRGGLMPATRGDEKPVFTGGVAAARLHGLAFADEQVSLSFTKYDSANICFVIEIPDNANFSGCDEIATITTGLAYVELGDGHSGVVDIIGIVPDDVTEISVAGQVVKPSNNVWHLRMDSSDPKLEIVVSGDGDASANLAR